MGRLACSIHASDPGRMARRTRDIWVNLIGQFERSGKRMGEFAKEREIPVGTLKNWVYRIRRAKEQDATPVLPVRVVSSRSPTASQLDDDAAVDVMLVRFASGAASGFIADVVTRLRRC